MELNAPSDPESACQSVCHLPHLRDNNQPVNHTSLSPIHKSNCKNKRGCYFQMLFRRFYFRCASVGLRIIRLLLKVLPGGLQTTDINTRPLC